MSTHYSDILCHPPYLHSITVNLRVKAQVFNSFEQTNLDLVFKQDRRLFELQHLFLLSRGNKDEGQLWFRISYVHMPLKHML